VRKFQTITDPAGGVEYHRRRKLMLLAEMRPVIEGESLGHPPRTAARFDFICDARMTGHMAAVGSAYEDSDPPEQNELVKVNGVEVRVLAVQMTVTCDSNYIQYEIEIERSHV
jgi:hypothetical protein